MTPKMTRSALVFYDISVQLVWKNILAEDYGSPVALALENTKPVSPNTGTTRYVSYQTLRQACLTNYVTLAQSVYWLVIVIPRMLAERSFQTPPPLFLSSSSLSCRCHLLFPYYDCYYISTVPARQHQLYIPT
jgi:hypothetical protein